MMSRKHGLNFAPCGEDDTHEAEISTGDAGPKAPRIDAASPTKTADPATKTRVRTSPCISPLLSPYFLVQVRLRGQGGPPT